MIYKNTFRIEPMTSALAGGLAHQSPAAPTRFQILRSPPPPPPPAVFAGRSRSTKSDRVSGEKGRPVARCREPASPKGKRCPATL